MYKSLNEFEFWQDLTLDYGVSCPRASEKPMFNFVHSLAPSFLIESSSFLQIKMTTVNNYMERSGSATIK